MLRWYERTGECVAEGVLWAIDIRGSIEWERKGERKWKRFTGIEIRARMGSGIRAEREEGISYAELFKGSEYGTSFSSLNESFWSFQICLFLQKTLIVPGANKTSIQPPLLTQTIPEHFASIVSQYGDRTAVISRSQQVRLSYRELDERSNILAAGLRERGMKKGDRVAVSLGNNWEFAVLTYALFKLGAILVSSLFFGV